MSRAREQQSWGHFALGNKSFPQKATHPHRIQSHVGETRSAQSFPVLWAVGRWLKFSDLGNDEQQRTVLCLTDPASGASPSHPSTPGLAPWDSRPSSKDRHFLNPSGLFLLPKLATPQPLHPQLWRPAQAQSLEMKRQGQKLLLVPWATSAGWPPRKPSRSQATVLASLSGSRTGR